MGSEEEEVRGGDLRRELGVPGAVLLGLGSIVGTGVFVSVGIAAGVAGPAVVLAVLLAAGVAVLNGLSSAQLAAARPRSGGTYEYGHAYLSPAAGFTAGWVFLCAKSASAATAALGFAGYALRLAGAPTNGVLVALALGCTAGVTFVVAGGLRRGWRLNAVVVTLTLLALGFFVLRGLPAAVAGGASRFRPFFPAASPVDAVLEATALLFVAYTGYGRVATLGEEVRDPRRTVPRAVVATLAVSLVLYLAVTAVAVGILGTEELARAAQREVAPLELAAQRAGGRTAGRILAAGAVTATLGVLVNLVLGLSRVLLAMARRGDAPRVLAAVHVGTASPRAAVLVAGAGVALLVLLRDVRFTWSLSAFTVLIYYGLTNLCALRQPRAEHFVPRVLPALGLAACALLATRVEARAWLAGLSLVAAGFAGRAVLRRAAARGGDRASGA